MLRGLIAIALLAVLVTAVTAWAAYLEVNAGSLAVFTEPAEIAIPPPAPPTGLDCDFESSEGTLTWAASPGATGYNVYHSPKGEDGFQFLHDVDGGETTTTVGPPAIGHLFRVTALGPGGESDPSNAVHCPPHDDEDDD